MRGAVETAFAPLQTVPAGDTRLNWRLQSGGLRRLVRITAEELTALATAAAALDRAGLLAQAAGLRDIDAKLRAVRQDTTRERLEADLKALLQAEGLGMRPGPRQPVDAALLALLREAILTRRIVPFRYRARTIGRRVGSGSSPTACSTATGPFWSRGRPTAGAAGRGCGLSPISATPGCPANALNATRTSISGAMPSGPSEPSRRRPSASSCASTRARRTTQPPSSSSRTRSSKPLATARSPCTSPPAATTKVLVPRHLGRQHDGGASRLRPRLAKMYAALAVHHGREARI